MLMATACVSTTPQSQIKGDLNNNGQIEVGQEGVDVEVNLSDVHMDAAEALGAGHWEALFTPVQIEGRALDMLNFDLTPTAEEKAAMEKEPAYGKPVVYMMSDGCTSGPTMADHLGYYAEAGLTAEGLKAIKALSAEGIPTNCTLIFSANQALLAAHAGATYVSPFLGRLDDIGQPGIDLIETIHDIFLNYPDIETQIIAASVRNPIHVTDCALAGADIATVPYKVIEQMLHHPLTDAGIEKFKADYTKVFGA